MADGEKRPDRPNLLKGLKAFFSTLDESQRKRVTDVTEFEIRELENLFILLMMGSFSGMPAPPSFISAELLPHLEHEIKVLNSRAVRSSDSFAEVMGVLDID